MLNNNILQILINNYKINTSIGLFKAVEKGNYEIVELLISKNKNFNRLIQNDKSLFHLAVEIGNIELVKYIIDMDKIDINAKDKEKKTILHYASQSENYELVNYLISLNIDINAKESIFNLIFFLM